MVKTSFCEKVIKCVEKDKRKKQKKAPPKKPPLPPKSEKVKKKQKEIIDKKKPKPEKIKIRPKKNKTASQYSFEELNGDQLVGMNVDDLDQDIADTSIKDITFIKGITQSMNDFYKENNDAFYDDKLTGKPLSRMKRIHEIINQKIRPTLTLQAKAKYREWKKENKGKRFNLKEAKDSFEEFYDKK